MLELCPIELSKLNRVVCLQLSLSYLVFGFGDLALSDVVLNQGFGEVKHSSAVVVNRPFYYMLKMSLVVDDLSPLSDTSCFSAVVKASEYIS